MAKYETLDVGVFVERRASSSPWQDWIWRPVAVVPGAPPVDGWSKTVEGDGWTQYHAATVPVELHHTEAEGYVVNLKAESPQVWVVLREDEDSDEFPYKVHLATVSAYRCQDYMDSAEEIVEAVPMPKAMIAWVERFVDEHFVATPFKKRKRDKVVVEDLKFGKEPIFARQGPATADGEADG